MTPPDVHSDDMFHDDPSLSAFARELREATEDAPLPAVGPTLAAVLAGQAPATAYPDLALPAEPRRRTVRRARVALAATGVAAGVLALAAAGSLPEPAQEQVARLASVVGVDLPDGDDGTPVSTTTSTSTTSTTVPTSTSVTPNTVRPSSATTVAEPADPITDTLPPGTSVVPGDRPRPNRGNDDRDGNRGRGNRDDGDERDDRDDEDRSGPGDGDRDEDDDEEREDERERERDAEEDELEASTTTTSTTEP